MKKPQLSVRLSGASRKLFGRLILRLTMNPVLLHLSGKFVDWSGREAPGAKLRPSELVARARLRFPGLPLSWAVEGYIALLATRDSACLRGFSAESYSQIDENVLRFRILSPAAKIRVGERWKREMRLIKEAK